MNVENRDAEKKSHSEDKHSPPVPGRPTKSIDLGYGDTLPSHFLQEQTFKLEYRQKARKVGIIISRSLLVINLYSSAFLGKIMMGDFIMKVNDELVFSKNAFYEMVKKFLKTHEKFTITVKRPKWLTPTAVVPKGYDIAPGYEYFSGLLVMYPNSSVGLNVKTFNSRVYIVRIEGGSMAVNTCMVGDCIVDVDGVPVTTVTDCSDKIIKTLQDKKYVQLTIERAVTPLTIQTVRCALIAEKSTPIDPRLATDTTKIGEDEAAKIKASRVPKPLAGILKTTGQGTGISGCGSKKPHIGVRPTSEEITIGCEPYNPLFFHKVKSKTAGYDMGASTTSTINSTSNDSVSIESSSQSQDKLSADKVVAVSPQPEDAQIKRPKLRQNVGQSRAEEPDISQKRPKTDHKDNFGKQPKVYAEDTAAHPKNEKNVEPLLVTPSTSPKNQFKTQIRSDTTKIRHQDSESSKENSGRQLISISMHTSFALYHADEASSCVTHNLENTFKIRVIELIPELQTQIAPYPKAQKLFDAYAHQLLSVDKNSG